MVAGLLHRLGIFAFYFEDLERVLAAQTAAFGWQYPTARALQEQLPATLWYWQQTPPLPVAVLGAAGQVLGFSRGVAWFGIALQQVLSVVSAALLLRLLFALTGGPWLSLAAAALFLFGVDLVVLEYNAFGQTFYEPLSMLLLLGSSCQLLRLRRTRRLRDAAWLGLLAGVLALCRAPYAAYGLLLLPALLAAGLPRPARHAGVFLAVYLVLPGLWAAKTFAVFGAWRASGSCWTGSNLAHGLAGAGFERPFQRSILSERERHPGWFTGLVRRHGIRPWLPIRELRLPKSLRRRDAAVQRALAGSNRRTNTPSQCALSGHFLSAWLRFARAHPAVILEKLRRSYLVFWQPIRNYAALYVSPLYVKPGFRSPFRPWELASAWRAGEVPESERVMKAGFRLGHRPWRPTWIPALGSLPLLFLCFEVLSVHLLTPAVLLLAAAAARRRAGGRGAGPLPGAALPYALALATASYAALVFNLAEHGENMRFRLTVEPLFVALAVANPILIARLWRPALAPLPAAAPGSASGPGA